MGIDKSIAPAAQLDETSGTYSASRTYRKATKAEMEERAAFLIGDAHEHGPVTVAPQPAPPESSCPAAASLRPGAS